MVLVLAPSSSIVTRCVYIYIGGCFSKCFEWCMCERYSPWMETDGYSRGLDAQDFYVVTMTAGWFLCRAFIASGEHSGV